MNYQEQFFAAVELLGVLDRAYYDPVQMAGFRNYLIDANSGRYSAEYANYVAGFPKITREFVRRLDPIRDLGRRCHSYSDLFNDLWRQRGGEKALWFLLTIGDVKYRGESIYNVTEQKVITTFQRGFRSEEELGVHVWLTFEDMTIVDLTIMASLLRLDRIDRKQYDANPVVVGKAGQLADFEYQPFLVDNDFARRVDRIAWAANPRKIS